MRRQTRRGGYAVEFALLLPILIILASGAVDLGWLLNQTDWLVAATAEGARLGAETDLEDDPLNAAEAAAALHWQVNDMPGTPTFTATFLNADPNLQVQVRGQHTVNLLFGFVPISRNLDYTVTMRMNDQTF